MLYRALILISEDHILHIFLPSILEWKTYYEITTFTISFSKILLISVTHLNLCREEKLVERAKALKVDIGTDPQADLGPVIGKQGPNSCWMEELLWYISLLSPFPLTFSAMLKCSQ